MRKRYGKLLIGIVVFLIAFGLIGVVYATTTDNYMEISTYRKGSTYTAPEKEGYVFAGWYEDAKFENPIGPEVKEGKYYAKFVDEKILTVKCQFAAGTTTESSTTSLRMITTIDTLNFSEVGFLFEGAGRKGDFVTTTVYTTLYGYVDANKTPYIPQQTFAPDSTYFAVMRITDIPKAVYGEIFKIVPKWMTLDGTVVQGEAKTFTIYDKAEPIAVDIYGDNEVDGTPWFCVASNDPFEADVNWNCRYVAKTGGVYVDGSLRTDAYLLKLYETRYVIKFEGAWEKPPTGTVMTIDGVFVDKYGKQMSKVKFGPVNFVYNGSYWHMYNEEVKLNTIGQRTDTHFLFTVTPSASLAYHEDGDWYRHNALYGGVYVNGVLQSAQPIQKLNAGDYFVYWGDTGIKVEEGTTIRIDGIFGNLSRAAKITSQTFGYRNGDWIEGLEVISNNGTEYVIVCGENASATEQMAAKELQAYLKKISSVEIPIQTDANEPAEKEIVVGQTNREASGDFDRSELGAEGFVVKTTDEKIWLVGGGDRGTLYSVYHFLETYMDCRFYTDQVEKVPTRSNVFVQKISGNKQIATFSFRNAGWKDYIGSDISAKRNVNVEAWGRDIAANAGDGISFALDHMGHTFSAFVSPSEYFGSHPEYFSMDESGQRVSDRQLCLSNPAVTELIIQGVREWLEKEPTAELVAVSQNDMQGPCLCPDCKKIYEEEGGAYSGAILRLVNAVAENIEADYPDVKVFTLAYQYTRSAPTKTKPRDNVMVAMCTIEGCFSHGHSNGCAQATNASYLDGSSNTITEDLQAWSAICDNLIVYDYAYNVHHSGVTFANFESMWENIHLYKQYDVDGVLMEGVFGSKNAEFGELRAYLVSKLLWNPNMSKEEYYNHMNDFLEGVYGPGWESVRAYIDLAEGLTEQMCFNLTPHPDTLFPVIQVEVNAKGTLPEDLTKEMVDNYTDTDWTKYWNWYTDAAENRITVDGERLFKQAMELAETEEQLKQLEKIYSQVEHLKSYYYKEQIDAGLVTFQTLISNFINAHSSDYSIVNKAELPVAIKNFALSQMYQNYAEYNRALAEKYVTYGVTEYRPSRSLSDWKQLNYANTPYNWHEWNSTIDMENGLDGSQTLWVKSNDSMSYSPLHWGNRYWPYSGGVYVNGVKTEVPLIKLYTNRYIIGVQYAGYTLQQGMEIKVEGTFGDGSQMIRFTSPTFVYMGNASSGKWLQAPMITVFDSAEKDVALHFEVDQNDTLAYAGDNSISYGAICGGVYVDGVLNSSIRLIKYGSNKYVIDWENSIVPTKGMKVTIDGIFGDASHVVKFNPITFTYNGEQDWYMHLKASATGLTDTMLWIKTSIADTLTHTAVDWSCRYEAKTGGIYVNGTKANLTLIKLYQDSYIIYLKDDGYETVDGMEVTIDGTFGDTNNTFVIGPITFRYDANQGVSGTWVQVDK